MDTDSLEVKSNPLVSIIVITYNSAKYVLETLESAKAQTYENIELIVSDDASSDNTVEICREWIDGNKDRFVRTELITIEKNTGIAPNCNRGVNVAQGVWVKLIAGDDTLENDILENYFKYLKRNSEVVCLYSNVKEYNLSFEPQNLLPLKDLKSHPINNTHNTANEQFKILLRSNPVWASTLMFRLDVVLLIGGFNEKYPFFEDRPILLALTKLGYKIHYLDILGAKYRRHDFSVQSSQREKIFISKFRLNNQEFFVREYSDYFSVSERIFMKYSLAKNLTIKKLFNNRTNLSIKILSYILEILPKLFLNKIILKVTKI